MNRCLVTFGVGHHADLLEIALPTFERFADRHGYDLIVANPDRKSTRLNSSHIQKSRMPSSA